MYDPEMRKDCPMRGNLGNCSPVGGFCMDAVSDEICEAVHNAYDHGFYNAVRTLKEQEPMQVKMDMYGNAYCPWCSTDGTIEMGAQRLHLGTQFCPYCGKAVKWDDGI